MGPIGLFCLCLCAISAQALGSPEENWQEWKNKTYKEALESPTSFLNAFSLSQARKGESLYLKVGKARRDLRWTKKAPESFDLQAEHTGSKIRIQINGKTLLYLENQPEKRRKKIDLKNGAIAEIVYGRRNSKLWGYLYDPDQVKSFSGFEFYPYNPTRVIEGRFKSQQPKVVSYRTVQGDSTEVRKLGNVSFEIEDQSYYLPAYSWQPATENIKHIALIFTDLSAGTETYGGGRELVVETPRGLKDGMTVELDFNKTLNFYCAHSPFWHCPVGLQKKIDVSLQAGEKLPRKKIMESGIKK